MPKSATRPADALDDLDLAGLDDATCEEDDSLDLEAYLDLEESPEIRALMQHVRGEAPAPPAAAAPRQEAPAEAPRVPRRFTPPEGHRASPTAGRRASLTAAPRQEAPAEAPRVPRRFTPPEDRRASPTADRRASVTAAPRQEARAEAPKVPTRFAPSGAPRASLTAAAAVAHALGAVQVQARQLVVACPRCEGRASIVIHGDRFKCYGCDASGNEAALAALLTGWDERRVAAWLSAAGEASRTTDADVRRPWRLSLFVR